MDCGLYLPPFKCVNIYFIKSIMCKQKRAIKTSAVKYMFAPQYDTLSIEKILAFSSQYAEVLNYLPEERDMHMLPRQVSKLMTLS